MKKTRRGRTKGWAQQLPEEEIVVQEQKGFAFTG